MKTVAAVLRMLLVLPPVLAFGPGCAMFRPRVDLALTSQPSALPQSVPSAEYVVGYADVLRLRIQGEQDLSGQYEIGADGRIQLGRERVLVDGLSHSEMIAAIANALRLPQEAVQVEITEYRSQQVYLVGQVVGFQRPVPYQGPETVVDILRRAGGITAGASPSHVYVVRSNLTEGRQPEVFHVDLRAIVLKNDQRTNVIIHPGDEIFVNETWECSLLRSMPPWLQPLYESFWGMRQKGESQVAQGTR